MTLDVLPERIRSKIEQREECWIWVGACLSNGYGQVKMAGAGMYAHRLVYTTLVGPIPAGLELDHLCRVRNCVRPEHLEAVTHTENVRRGKSPSALNTKKIHCPQGHPYDEENTYWYPAGQRDCRACCRERNRQYRARLRGSL